MEAADDESGAAAVMGPHVVVSGFLFSKDMRHEPTQFTGFLRSHKEDPQKHKIPVPVIFRPTAVRMIHDNRNKKNKESQGTCRIVNSASCMGCILSQTSCLMLSFVLLKC